MLDEISLGSSPATESCAQLGQDDYADQAKRECRAYKGQLFRVLDRLAPSADTSIIELRTKGFRHDFGTYYEVVVKYDADDTKAADLAILLENNMPQEWDTMARQELGLTETE